MVPGTRVADRFTIERRIGAGGMGTVYVARDSTNGDRVALKVLLGTNSASLDHERFSREAAVLSELAHPGIVRYVAHGVDEEGAPYLAMEWVEGETLHVRLADPIARDEAIALVRAVADALGAAHARGIVHRDVKPSNIVLAGGDVHQPRLLDFGIARRQTGDRVTETGSVIGTPGYMAPEQARGMTALDARADVYALGCLLFRCIAGRPPFVGEHAVAVLARTILEEPPRLMELCPDVSMRLDEIVASMLARDPRSRPTDGAAVVAALAELSSDDTEAAPPSLVSDVSITTTEQRFVTAVLGSPRGGSASACDPTVLAEIAAAHDARFDALAGGSFVFVFATTSAPTDLAMRACHGALAVCGATKEVSLAVVSGRTVLRGSTPIGELIDRAAGAVTETEPGAIAVDESTASLVGERFALAGNEGARRLRSARREALGMPIGRTLLGRSTPCVGRDRELSFLEGLYDESVEERAARVAVVIAPAGAGKSRVRRELVARVAGKAPPPLVLLALGDPLAASAPMSMLGETLRRAAGCFDLDPGSDQAEHLRAWLVGRLDAGSAAAIVPLLLEIAGLAPSSTRARSGRIDDSGRAALLRAWTNWIDAELARQPVLVVLEDLHWGDQATVDFLDASLRAFASRPLVVLALARPEVKTVFPRVWADREPHEIRLGPLTRTASAALVRAVVPSDTDETTITALVDRAGGNAFFLEELIRTFAAGNEKSALPDTILAMVQSRLDALGPELTRVLRAASVFGGSFWREGVGAVLGVGQDSRRLEMWLSTLVDRELVEVKPGTTIPGAHELVFRHDMVREGAYAMLVDEDRRLAHRLAAEWLGAAGSRDAAVLVEHYDRAGETANAIKWSLIDARRALDALDASAVARAERGIRLGATGVALGALLMVQAHVLEVAGEMRGFELGARAIEHLPRGSATWYDAALLRVLHQIRIQDGDGIASTSQELVETTPAPGDVDAEVEYVVALAGALEIVGRTERFALIPLFVGALMPYLGRASEMPPRAASRLETVLSMHYSLTRQPEAALRAAERSAALARAGAELTLMAELNVLQRRMSIGALPYAEASALLERILLEADRIAAKIIHSIARYALAVFASFCGEHARAYEVTSALIATDDAFRPPSFIFRVELMRAQSVLRMGRAAEARAMLEHLPEIAPDSPLRWRAAMCRAESLLLDGDASEAIAIIEELRPRMTPSPFEQIEADCALLHARAYVSAGNEPRARDVIAAAVRDLRTDAATIETPELRRSFLENVPTHRELLALAAERGL